MFVVNNRNLFLDNADLYSIKTRNSCKLHLPSTAFVHCLILLTNPMLLCNHMDENKSNQIKGKESINVNSPYRYVL
jgi:hypothetical protein